MAKKLHFHLLSPLRSTYCCCFLLCLPYMTAAPYDYYLVNCGSDENVSTGRDGRVFQGESGSQFLSITGGGSISDPTARNTNRLYQTARIFKTKKASYVFKISGNGTYGVRLHFFPFFSRGYNLSAAVFQVLVSGVSLSRDTKHETHDSVILKECLLMVTGNKLVISFVPSTDVAFVSAIEVFGGRSLISDTAKPVSPKVNGELQGLLGNLFEPVYRINVGGPTIVDELGRTWIPDDEFLTDPEAAQKAVRPIPITNGEALIPDVAPEKVYKTCKQMKQDNVSLQQNFKITWSFGVNPASKYLVRLHFCDIVSDGDLSFNVFLGNDLAEENLALFEIKNSLAAPYYSDFRVDSDASTPRINISIGPSELTSREKANAILNGVEIMLMNGVLKQVSANDSGKLPISAIIGLSLGGILALLLLLLSVFLLVLKRQSNRTIAPNRTIDNSGSLDWLPLSMHGSSSHAAERTTAMLHPTVNLELKIPLVDIQLATDNFHENSLLGRGGFGDVYKGVLKDGTNVAVKRGKRGSGQGFREFKAEIMVLSKIRHRHLVSLIGFCDEQSEMILVYELMENGPLKNHLYGSDLPCLSWEHRLRICIDAARGLHYLHTGIGQPIIHRDVKSANILLDGNKVAKLADFGLSKVVESLDQSHVTTVVKGSFGYLDPEYYKLQQLTEKSDVYSFGVVLLEVLCARGVVVPALPRDQVSLAEWAMRMMKEELVSQIIDPRLVGCIDSNSLRKFRETVQMCLAERGADRPTMGDVVWNLEYALQLQENVVERDKYEVSDTSVVGLTLLELERDDPTVTSHEIPGLTASGISFTAV